MTTDKDFLQLVNDRIKVYNSHSRKEYDVQKNKRRIKYAPTKYNLLEDNGWR